MCRCWTFYSMVWLCLQKRYYNYSYTYTKCINYCCTLNDVVQVDLNETDMSGIKFSCNTDADHRINFFIVAVDRKTNSAVFKSELLSCASTQMVQITNLMCGNRQYSISTHFAFANGSLTTCLLSNTTTIHSVGCPTTNIGKYKWPHEIALNWC